jgi:hypothetical protein
LVYPSVILIAENFCHLGVSEPGGHQWIAAANLLDLPKLPESRPDRFASSAERCFVGATVRETVRFDVLAGIRGPSYFVEFAKCRETNHLYGNPTFEQGGGHSNSMIPRGAWPQRVPATTV